GPLGGEQIVADHQPRQHRFARDREGAEDEGAEHQHRDDQLDEEPEEAAFLLFRGGSPGFGGGLRLRVGQVCYRFTARGLTHVTLSGRIARNGGTQASAEREFWSFWRFQIIARAPSATACL